MKRADLAAAIAARIPVAGHLVVCGLGSTSRAWRDTDAPHLTYYASDPMGLAPGLALGLALARPDQEVVLLEGDGDLLMNAGVLVTIAGAAPTNLRTVVFRNDRYETGGGQPVAAAARLSIGGLAQAAGWAWAAETPSEPEADAAEIERLLGAWRAAPAPALLSVRVEPQPAPYGGPGPASGVAERVEFQRRLAELSPDPRAATRPAPPDPTATR